MKIIALFFASITSLFVSGCGTLPTRDTKNHAIVMNKLPQGHYVDFYVGTKLEFKEVPADSMRKIYFRMYNDYENIPLTSKVYIYTQTGERLFIRDTTQFVRIGGRNHFTTVTWEEFVDRPNITTRNSPEYDYTIGFGSGVVGGGSYGSGRSTYTAGPGNPVNTSTGTYDKHSTYTAGSGNQPNTTPAYNKQSTYTKGSQNYGTRSNSGGNSGGSRKVVK